MSSLPSTWNIFSRHPIIPLNSLLKQNIYNTVHIMQYLLEYCICAWDLFAIWYFIVLSQSR